MISMICIFLSAMYFVRYFICIGSFNPHNSTMRYILLPCAYFTNEELETERLSNWPELKQLISSKGRMITHATRIPSQFIKTLCYISFIRELKRLVKFLHFQTILVPSFQPDVATAINLLLLRQPTSSLVYLSGVYIITIFRPLLKISNLRNS